MARKYTSLTTARPKSVSPLKSIKARWPKGCQGGVTNALMIGISTLILNTAIACWLSTTKGFNDALVVIQRRSCSSSRNITIFVHLIINIFATLLMSASNYFMQILSSPLREEVDAAHAAKKWMYIGVPNFKNLRHIPWTRRLLFLTLAVSSLPVHLLWNSVFIQELPANNYNIAMVSKDFILGAPVDAEPYFCSVSLAEQFKNWLDSARQNSTNLTVAECYTTLNVKSFTSDYSNFALVMNVHNSSNSLLEVLSFRWNVHFTEPPTEFCEEPRSTIGQSRYGWGYGIDQSNHHFLLELESDNGEKWQPDYCLAQKTQRTCHIGFTPITVWVVLAANLFRVVCFYGTLLWIRTSSKPLIVTGDAIQSFLSKPDPDLSQRCLSSISRVKKDPKFWTTTEMPLRWLPERQAWFNGAPLSSWLSLFLPAVAGLSYVIFLYIFRDLNRWLRRGSLQQTPQSSSRKTGNSTMVSLQVYFLPIPLRLSIRISTQPITPSSHPC